MKANSDILDLGERFDIETPHVRHVASLALHLFDGFSHWIGPAKEDRQTLYAAAILHDIAYAFDPANHVVEGACVLTDNPIPGIAAGEGETVVGIVLLHKRDWRRMLEHELFPRVEKKQLDRIKKLAAILRIADGLDHGHIQDARIFYCKRGKKVDKVGVECGWYDGNIPWAEKKADLWEAVFKRPFRFEGRMKRSKKVFTGVVDRDDSAITAARRILYSQWCIMRDNVPALMDRQAAGCIHKYNAALDHFRAGLHLFTPVLGNTCAADLNDRFRCLSDQLKPFNEAVLVQRFLEKMESKSNQRFVTEGTSTLSIEEIHGGIRAILDDDSCLETVRMTGRFLRVELPRLERDRNDLSFAELAGKSLLIALSRIMSVDTSMLHTGEIAQIEELQHYTAVGCCYSEFAAPVFGKHTQRAAKHLNTVTSALKDMQLARMLFNTFGNTVIRGQIEEFDDDAQQRFKRGWRKFTENRDRLH